MEKRNFITPLRTVDSSDDGDELVKSAADLFSGREKNPQSANSQFEKRAQAEDEKTDSL